MTSIKFHGIKPYRSKIWFLPLGLTYETDTLLAPFYTNYVLDMGFLCFHIKVSFSVWEDRLK